MVTDNQTLLVGEHVERGIDQGLGHKRHGAQGGGRGQLTAITDGTAASIVTAVKVPHIHQLNCCERRWFKDGPPSDHVGPALFQHLLFINQAPFVLRMGHRLTTLVQHYSNIFCL